MDCALTRSRCIKVMGCHQYCTFTVYTLTVIHCIYHGVLYGDTVQKHVSTSVFGEVFGSTAVLQLLCPNHNQVVGLVRLGVKMTNCKNSQKCQRNSLKKIRTLSHTNYNWWNWKLPSLKMKVVYFGTMSFLEMFPHLKCTYIMSCFLRPNHLHNALRKSF